MTLSKTLISGSSVSTGSFGMLQIGSTDIRGTDDDDIFISNDGRDSCLKVGQIVTGNQGGGAVTLRDGSNYGIVHSIGSINITGHYYAFNNSSYITVANGQTNKSYAGFANVTSFSDVNSRFTGLKGITQQTLATTMDSTLTSNSAVMGIENLVDVVESTNYIQNIYGYKSIVNLDDGRTASNVYGQYTEIDIEAAHEVDGNVYGSYIKVVDDDRSAGIVEGLTLEGAGINNNNHHSFYRRMTITKAHSGDNTVIAEVCKIPALSIIKRITATLITKSNLGTYVLNLNLSTSTGTSADGALANASTTITVPEVLGAGGVATYAQNSATVLGTAADIVASSGATNKTIYTTQPTTTVVGTADTFLYICNAGTGNGTSDSNATVIDVVVDYIGVD